MNAPDPMKTPGHPPEPGPDDAPTIVSVEIVVAVQSRALEEAPDETLRMARVEAEERAIDADAALPEERPEIVGTYHELGDVLERERHPAEYLDALRAQGHDLMDLSFLVYRARP